MGRKTIPEEIRVRVYWWPDEENGNKIVFDTDEIEREFQDKLEAIRNEFEGKTC